MNLVPRIPVPAGMALLPYQEEAVRWMSSRRAMLLADEPGLGKTIMTCGFMNMFPRIKSALVVCPASMRGAWHRASCGWLMTKPETFTVLSYEKMVQLDKAFPWDLVVFDEAHYLKNMGAIRSREARKIRARCRILLTGTPIPDRPIDGFHLLHLLDPAAWTLKDYHRFGVRYCAGKQVYVSRTKKVWDFSGASRHAELAEILRPVMLRRLKRDVAKQIPAKTRRVVEFSMEGVSEEVLDLIAAEAELGVTEYSTARRALGVAKAKLCAGFIENLLEQHVPVVAFAHHLDVIGELLHLLRKWKPVVIEGKTSGAQRDRAVEDFQSGKTNLFIGQLRAAGTGITLTRSSHVAMCEQDWTPSVLGQAEDRCNRIGSVNPLTVYYLVYENSLDARMSRKWATKQTDIDLIVDGGKR